MGEELQPWVIAFIALGSLIALAAIGTYVFECAYHRGYRPFGWGKEPGMQSGQADPEYTLPHMSNAVVSVPDTANSKDDPPSPNASVAKIAAAAEKGAKVTTLRLVKSAGSTSADESTVDDDDDEGHADAIDDIEAQRQTIKVSRAMPDVNNDEAVTIQVDADPLPSSTFASASRPTSLESSSGGRRPSVPGPAKVNESSRMRDVERGEAGIKALVASGW